MGHNHHSSDAVEQDRVAHLVKPICDGDRGLVSAQIRRGPGRGPQPTLLGAVLHRHQLIPDPASQLAVHISEMAVNSTAKHSGSSIERLSSLASGPDFITGYVADPRGV
jgi:hypothetical protein